MNNTIRNSAMGTCAGYGLLIPMALALALCPWGCTKYAAPHPTQQEEAPMQPAPVQVDAGCPGSGSRAAPLLPQGRLLTEEASQASRDQLCALKSALGSPFCKKYLPVEEVKP